MIISTERDHLLHVDLEQWHAPTRSRQSAITLGTLNNAELFPAFDISLLFECFSPLFGQFTRQAHSPC